MFYKKQTGFSPFNLGDQEIEFLITKADRAKVGQIFTFGKDYFIKNSENEIQLADLKIEELQEELKNYKNLSIFAFIMKKLNKGVKNG